MKNVFLLSMIFWLLCSVSTTIAFGVEAEDTSTTSQEPANWHAVGQEIGEAAHAVGDATADSSKKIWTETRKESAKAWGAAKKESAEAWEAAKKQGKTAWEEGKASIHEATAPAPATPKAD